MKMREKKIRRAEEIAKISKFTAADYLYGLAFLYHQAGEAENDPVRSQSHFRRAFWLRELGERCER